MKMGVLFRTEWIKARGRLAARVPVLLFITIMLIFFGGPFYNAVKQGKQPEALPAAWTSIISEMPPLGIFFAGVVLMLLISSEFTWRTARQNVIDGLSREQWFGAKLILLPVTVILFLVLQVGIGGAFALAGTDLGATSGPLMSTVDLAAVGGFGLALLGMGSLAFMLAFLTRNSGSAISFFFLYVVIGESLLGLLISRIDALAPVIKYLPANVFMKLPERITFDPVYLERVTAAALEAGRTPPPAPNTSLIVTLSLIYTIAFIATAFIVYRRRDL